MISRIRNNCASGNTVIHNNVAYLSGIVPTDLSNNIIEQTYEVLSLLDTELVKINSSKCDILNMTIYLKDASLYDDMNIAFNHWIKGFPSPAISVIGIVNFLNPRCFIEIVVTAALSNNTELYYLKMF